MLRPDPSVGRSQGRLSGRTATPSVLPPPGVPLRHGVTAARGGFSRGARRRARRRASRTRSARRGRSSGRDVRSQPPGSAGGILKGT